MANYGTYQFTPEMAQWLFTPLSWDGKVEKQLTCECGGKQFNTEGKCTVCGKQR